MEEQRGTIEANIDSNVTPRRVSRIAGALISPYTPPSSPAFQLNTPKPASYALPTSTIPNYYSNIIKSPVRQAQGSAEQPTAPPIYTPQPTSSLTFPTLPSPQVQTSPHHDASSLVVATPIGHLMTNKWPEWLKAWYSIFSLLPFGDTWHKLMTLWVELEHGYGFVSPAKGLTGRLELVHELAKAKFATDFRPSTVSPSRIAELWWSWWLLLNAPTRIASANGRLIPGADKGSIEISQLRAPGKNGWLGLLYSLMIWRESAGDGEIKDWEVAVSDVYWVTRRLCESSYYCPTAEVIPTLKRSLDVPPADPDGGCSKRVKAARSYRY
ncbi:hypothetical protein PILCRDRAFT_8691 [Piloderma croceum F 1598]|uniref:Uncharacterized protein n=1 Tax=Piloderma croceum (strain F 1598) TaxID=765440 RepID=A0A0C3FAM9_PILCF|nr:hypothetical protein PILCRDRAFT_8691 [Piloderma croceum F 1598]